WNVRIESVLGLPSHFVPPNGTKKAQFVCEEAEELYLDMLPRAELAELLRWGTFLGSGVARSGWDDSNGWLPSLRTWHAGGLRFDLNTDVYMLNTSDRGEIPILRDDPNWTLFTPYGHKYGRLNGLVRSAAMLFLCRQWVFRDRARHSEVHGQ